MGTLLLSPSIALTEPHFPPVSPQDCGLVERCRKDVESKPLPQLKTNEI